MRPASNTNYVKYYILFLTIISVIVCLLYIGNYCNQKCYATCLEMCNDHYSSATHYTTCLNTLLYIH